jgi:hypothetical protein
MSVSGHWVDDMKIELRSEYTVQPSTVYGVADDVSGIHV